MTTHRPHPADLGADPLAALVPRVARGDEAAFRALYDTLGPRVLGLALRILRDRAAAEEAVVDVFTQVWRQCSRFDASKGSVASWVLTLARTRSIDLARVVERRTRREVELEGRLVEGVHDPLRSPLDHASDGERAQHVRRALERLPPEQRQALELAFFSGLSHSQVASAVRAPLGTIKTRIRTGLTTLRTALAGAVGEHR